jgi:ATP/maltotriose-dependent transcriptional regulator MalT/DNA-binding SARP family transcriptional activator
LASVSERKRLYKVLDEAGSRPVCFITAPAGAGKTTLAASYLKARRRPCLWLQLEADNAYPASFVYYLRLAAQRIAPRRAAKLLLLTAEYQLGLPAFAKHLFETLAQVLPADTILVLDNYQEVGVDAALHDFLAEGLTALPPGMRLLCLSRQAPPAALARRRVEGALAVVEWETLRFTMEETAAMVKLQYGERVSPSVTALQQLHARTHGWAAGIMLLLDAPVTTTDGPHMEQGDQATFDYLASEVFQRLDPAARALLPPLAIPSAVSAAMAAALTGNPHVRQQLEELVRANCFTTRHVSGYYQFHPLFRNFLLNELRTSCSGADQQRLQRTAAKLLVDEDQPEEAAQLFIDTEDWISLSELIIQNAKGLLSQGRHDTLATWLHALPAELLDANPWLLFYLGAARFPYDLGESRTLFERATEHFRDAGNDMAGFVLAWSGVIQAIATDWSDSSLLGHWIELAEQRIVPHLLQLAPELQGRVIQGIFLALQFHRPEHPDMRRWAERLETIVGQRTNPSERVQMGGSLLLYHMFWIGDLQSAERIVRSIRPQRLDSLTPAARIQWHFVHARWLWQHNLNDEALGEVENAIDQAKKSGVRFLDFVIQIGGVFASMNAQNTDAAARYLAQAERPTSTLRSFELAHHQAHCAWLERVRGDAVAARRRNEWAVSIAISTSGAFEQVNLRTQLAHSLRECGDYTEAFAQCKQALTLARSMHGRWTEYLALACLAETACASGDAARGLVALRETYRIARENGYRSLMWQDPKSMAYLCSRALAANIEPEHCRALIAAHRLPPPDASRLAEYWPFPLKIHTLGRFQLMKDDLPMRFEGKPQRKPLELLKALIALGGRDVRDQRLSAILWPDAAGDAAHSAFSTTLARLRKLLGGDDTLVVQDGRVSLNPRHCWLDTWALEVRIAATESGPVEVGASTPVLRLYRGAFLEQESDAAWVLPARERLRSRFLRYLTSEARRLGAAGHREQAVTLYLQGLEIDPLIEDFYRGLMTAYGELGRKSEALACFERCRALLAKTLGVQPGAETCALAERLRQP